MGFVRIEQPIREFATRTRWPNISPLSSQCHKDMIVGLSRVLGSGERRTAMLYIWASHISPFEDLRIFGLV